MVIKNEKDRYLESCIRWAQQFLDEIFVYDDRSTDGSAELAHELGCRTVLRGENVPTFLEHEGRFRAAAWRSLESVMKPSSNDWIFALDADEFPVSDKDPIRLAIEKSIKKANYNGKPAVVLPFPEIFKIENGKFYSRVDGEWGRIRGSRLFKYRPNAQWNSKPMGCGSEPTYVAQGRASLNCFGLSVLHLGYAKVEDQYNKYKRYSSLVKHGHADKHIKSIVTPPKLVEWEGPIPELGI